MDFGYTIDTREDYCLIHLKGDLMEKNQASELMDELELQAEKGAENFIINMEAFRYMNSTGLNVLLGILAKARMKGGEAVICSVPEKIKSLLVITKLVNVFPVVDNEAEALSTLQGK